MRFLFLFLLISPVLHAQELEEVPLKKVRYTNSFLSGGSVGGSEELWGMSVSTFHGIKVERWRFLIGIGMDGYSDWLTYPMMGSVSFDLSHPKKKKGLYLIVNSGYAFADKTIPIEWTDSFSDKGGMIFNPMIGYRITIGSVDLYFQSGYKNQQVSYRYSYNYGGWGGSPGSGYKYKVDQDLNRFVFQIGFGF